MQNKNCNSFTAWHVMYYHIALPMPYYLAHTHPTMFYTHLVRQHHACLCWKLPKCLTLWMFQSAQQQKSLWVGDTNHEQSTSWPQDGWRPLMDLPLQWIQWWRLPHVKIKRWQKCYHLFIQLYPLHSLLTHSPYVEVTCTPTILMATVMGASAWIEFVHMLLSSMHILRSTYSVLEVHPK